MNNQRIASERPRTCSYLVNCIGHNPDPGYIYRFPYILVLESMPLCLRKVQRIRTELAPHDGGQGTGDGEPVTSEQHPGVSRLRTVPALRFGRIVASSNYYRRQMHE